jgi:hypothetical protein
MPGRRRQPGLPGNRRCRHSRARAGKSDGSSFNSNSSLRSCLHCAHRIAGDISQRRLSTLAVVQWVAAHRHSRVSRRYFRLDRLRSTAPRGSPGPNAKHLDLEALACSLLNHRATARLRSAAAAAQHGQWSVAGSSNNLRSRPPYSSPPIPARNGVSARPCEASERAQDRLNGVRDRPGPIAAHSSRTGSGCAARVATIIRRRC